jgi:hypothetical protein
MRLLSFIPAVVALFISSAASAQAWEEYVNRGDFFTVNFPGDPTVQEITYKTAKGTSLPAHVYTATDARGRYTMTVVDYSSASQDELASAVDEAVKAIRAKGTPKYDAVNMLDMHRSWRITVETPDKRRLLGEVLTADNKHLYISQADTALNVPPPAQFSVSLQILDANGVRIRNKEVKGETPDEVVPVTEKARIIDTAEMLKQVVGNWKAPGGSCDNAFLKAQTRAKTVRGEEALNGTVTNSGMVIEGLLIINGPRVGQIVNAKTDKVIFIFDPKGDKMDISALGPPALGWPDVTLDFCPGTRKI